MGFLSDLRLDSQIGRVDETAKLALCAGFSKETALTGESFDSAQASDTAFKRCSHEKDQKDSGRHGLSHRSLTHSFQKGAATTAICPGTDPTNQASDTAFKRCSHEKDQEDSGRHGLIHRRLTHSFQKCAATTAICPGADPANVMRACR
ncbi:unnamed protein product [Strongylus vulgaris]|uniref:Uncharacterized protein n=1 Tax=Strongylus vulgaris TaxID=40348 RepID=A0A3P7JFR5_STRVU|nr:unnamed protein product [Strongylus vulgaris]